MPVKCFLIEPLKIKDDDGHYIWYRPDTGERFQKYKWPVGAVWRVTWYEDYKPWTGHDGKSYSAMTPGGEWFIDGRASNCGSACKNCGVKYRDHEQQTRCTNYEDAVPQHKCWCRHGEAPNFTVDKVGLTCDAGAGSIATGSYHGFLRNGEFT